MAERQLPCPDCGSPVRPDRDQLCPRCGYPLMFLRRPAEDDARAVPRQPGEREDPTGRFSSPPPRNQATTYGRTPGQLPCPRCGYANEQARIRCERCGHELRQARPHAVVLGPKAPVAKTRGGNLWWLYVLLALAVLSMAALAAVVVWKYLL